MPHWYWDRKELRSTPSQATTSLVKSVIDFDTEMRYRREGVRFIIEVGKELNLSHTTMATGAVYFHRFYMFHTFQDFPKYVVATSCLVLAGKAEETPKKFKDVISKVRELTNNRQFATFGAEPKEEVMVVERILLQTIKFDLQVDHPYSSLIKYAKCLRGDKTKLQKMVQMSWTFVNDSLCTTLCLQWEPEIVAIALMYLAAKLSKFEVKDWNDRRDWHRHWWDQFVENLDVDVLEDICHQVLDLYGQPHTAAKELAESPPPTSGNSSNGPKSTFRKSSPPLPPPPMDVKPPRPQTPPAPPLPANPPSLMTKAAVGAPPMFQASQQQQPLQAATPPIVSGQSRTAVVPVPLPGTAPPPTIANHASFGHLPPTAAPPPHVYCAPSATQPAPPPPAGAPPSDPRFPPPPQSHTGFGYPPLRNPLPPFYNQPPPPPPPAAPGSGRPTPHGGGPSHARY